MPNPGLYGMLLHECDDCQERPPRRIRNATVVEFNKLLEWSIEAAVGDFMIAEDDEEKVAHVSSFS
jgi:hypothetical protein